MSGDSADSRGEMKSGSPAEMATPSPDDRFHHCTYHEVIHEFDPNGPVWADTPKTRCFFAPMKLRPRPRSASSATSTRKVKSPSLILCKSHVRCRPEINFGLWPPILPGATLPVSRRSRTQLMAVLMLTPNCFAARWHEMPPVLTAATTRSRRSIE